MTAPSALASRPVGGLVEYDETRRLVVLAPVLIGAALVGGLIAGQAAMGIRPPLAALPLVPVLPLAIWRWPRVGPLLLLAAATLIEQHPYFVGGRPGAFTSQLPFFRSVGGSSVILPAEGVIVLTAVVWMLKAAVESGLAVPRSPLGRTIVVFWGLLLVAFALGLARGGAFNFALWELRPWILLAGSYVLAAVLLTDRRGLQAVLWVMVLGSGFKAVQGTVMFFTFVRQMRPRPEAILGHEESFFFGMFVLLVLGLWIYGQMRLLKWTSTALLPVVFVANLANARRTAWAVLLIGIAVLLALAWVTRREKRKVVGPLFILIAIVCAVYFPLYWNKGEGALGQPVRAVRSTVAPNERDLNSNKYRDAENANLLANIRQAGPLGRGVGIPIVYDDTIVDISNLDPMIAYIPHNGLLWIWLRLGLLGEIVLWMLFGVALIAACRLARAADPLVALFGVVTGCAVVAWVIIGYQDMGLGSFRIAVAMGTLFGCVEAASRWPGSAVRESQALPAKVR